MLCKLVRHFHVRHFQSTQHCSTEFSSVSVDSISVRQAALTTKRDALRERFDDALELKTGIDRRRTRLDAALRDALTSGELTDFRSSVDSSCRLRLDEQWIDDRVEICQKQLSALMNSILSSSEATEC